MTKKSQKSGYTNPFTAEAVMNSPMMYGGNTHNGTGGKQSDHMIVPQGCSFWTKIKCGAALVACGGVCYVSLGSACVACFAALGKSKCLSCLT
jgi:hypothetical protein